MATALRLESLEPMAALPGGEVRVRGRGFRPGIALAQLRVSGHPAAVQVGADTQILARVPEGTLSGPVEVVADDGRKSNAIPLEIGVLVAENVHPVCNPALDAEGNLYVTLSGARAQKTPVSLFRLDANYHLKAFSSAIINPSGIVFDRQGLMFVSSRHEGAVYTVDPSGAATLYMQGLGVATGLALDRDGNLYVGDRSGTVFKIDSRRNTFVFATLEPSVAAYHMAFGADDYLYVAGPSASSYDSVWRISPAGAVEAYYTGLGRPQGLAFDTGGNLYVVASLHGRRGVVRIDPGRNAELVVAAYGLVGLAFARGPALMLASTNALFHLPWAVGGLLQP